MQHFPQHEPAHKLQSLAQTSHKLIMARPSHALICVFCPTQHSIPCPLHMGNVRTGTLVGPAVGISFEQDVTCRLRLLSACAHPDQKRCPLGQLIDLPGAASDTSKMCAHAVGPCKAQHAKDALPHLQAPHTASPGPKCMAEQAEGVRLDTGAWLFAGASSTGSLATHLTTPFSCT